MDEEVEEDDEEAEEDEEEKEEEEEDDKERLPLRTDCSSPSKRNAKARAQLWRSNHW